MQSEHLDSSPPDDAAIPFDAVVMLTWSDWRREPRSNRYHYATRFACRFPVYFVQPDSSDGLIRAEPIEGHNITLIHAPSVYDDQAAVALARSFATQRVRRPLL
jgi:hypothetical protein